MGSRDRDGTMQHHQPPLLSSLVVRPSNSDGGGSGDKSGGGGRAPGASDYEPGEFRRDPPPYSRADRYANDPGYRNRAGSASPVRRKVADRHYSPDIDRKGGPPRSREYGGARDRGRYREISPPYGRDRVGLRPVGRGFDGPGFGPGPLRGEGMARNNPNVRPREGDWLCPDPLCGNLNFARREYCNKCRRSRNPGGGSPRRGYTGPPPPPRRLPAPPMDRSPARLINNGYRSPLRGWARDGTRDFVPGGLPPPRHEGRFSDPMRRDRLGYPEDDYRERGKFDRSMPVDWGHRDRGRDSFYNERRGFERRPISPPLPPPPLPRDRWAHDARERSRSPIRGGPLPKDYRRDMYIEQGRDNRRIVGRGRIGDAY